MMDSRFQIGITDVSCVDGIVTWKSGMQIDADGSARAYAPLGSALRGLDYLGNAGKPGDWWALVCDDDGVPYIQDHDDPCPGYYISATALCDRGLALKNPRRYVNSEVIPYIAVPRELLRKTGVRLGDFAIVERADKKHGAIVADIGPRGHIGEGSIALAKALGIPDSPRNGGVARGVSYTIFADSLSNPPWPRYDIDTIAKRIAAERLRLQ